MTGGWLPPDVSKAAFNAIGPNIAPVTKEIRRALEDASKRIRKAASDSFAAIGKDTKKLNIFGPKFAKSMKKAAPYANVVLDMVGIFLQILDAMGVLEPIMTLFNGVLQMIGGSIMQTLAPAMQHLADVLFSPDMMELWRMLGFLIGVVLAAALNTFASVLKALAPVLKPLILLLGGHMVFIIVLLTKAIGLLILGGLLPLMMTIYAVGLVIAGIIGFFTGTDAMGAWSNMMLPVIGGMAVGMAEILTMGRGGYIPPTSGGTLAIIGEGGEGEFVVPESKMGSIGGSEELLWATQDNGEKLDALITVTRNRSRLI